MAALTRMQHLRQRAFDGTIGLEVDVHGKLLSSDVMIMTQGYHHARWLPIVAPICLNTRLAHIFCTVANFSPGSCRYANVTPECKSPLDSSCFWQMMCASSVFLDATRT